jgi:[pyruvate, water dikinase]-phosphate phosphotransferase / [pyruvate, water dikinase] kinase
MKRYVYMISDGTGITAEALGNSLISQFESIEFSKITIPYVDTLEKAKQATQRINESFNETQTKPLVFTTLLNPEIRHHIKIANACIFDLFNTFLEPLEHELHAKSSYTVGRSHAVVNQEKYSHRIEAVEFALAHDDGVRINHYDKADIILIGVSRCGKTPSCLYMALQYGILTANYPFTDEDLSNLRLPESLRSFKPKLFGLTIDAERLQSIRKERRPNSRYASLEQCRLEVNEVESMLKRERVPFINSTHYSIEEISTRILARAGIKRRIL